MAEEDAHVLKISDLIHQTSPLTGASSLTSLFSPTSSSSSFLQSGKNLLTEQPNNNSNTSNTSPSPSFLVPFSIPVVLIGTVSLPSENPNCSNKYCFEYSDDSSCVCCDVISFSMRMIGRKIRVKAWNFIPLQHSSGGVLEIIKWDFHDSALDSCCYPVFDSIEIGSVYSSTYSPVEDKCKNYSIYGLTESMSPVSLIPRSMGDYHSQNPLGFIVKIMVCQCKSCKSKPTNMASLSVQKQGDHEFTKCCFVCFTGPSSRFHPVLAKLVGNVVVISRLKKKLIFIGNDQSHLLYVTTENSVLHLHRICKKLLSLGRNVHKWKGHCGVYHGVVKGIHVNGTVVELDHEVWLLLSDQLLTAPHSLRVGAVVSMRNVHFVNPKYSWTKMLLLGACLNTSITIQSFSPLEASCYTVSRFQTQLAKFIDSLTFSARLWAILTVSCFMKKFSGFLSENEILGSKHKEGVAQMFISSHLPSSMFHSRQGIFMELCLHGSCGCFSEPFCGDLKLVLPISMFINHCEAMCPRVISHQSKKFDLFHEGPLNSQHLQSENMCIVLLGILKASPSSGMLQLVDASGSIDALVPSFPSLQEASSIYEVARYVVVMDGMPETRPHPGLIDHVSISCKQILLGTSWAREKKLRMAVCFRMKTETCNELYFYPSLPWNSDSMELQGGRFHLIRLALTSSPPPKVALAPDFGSSDSWPSNSSIPISLQHVSSGTIYQLIRQAEIKPVQFNCRVVAVRVLILRGHRKCCSLLSEVHSAQQAIDIPLAGFVLDDGSCSCCCWSSRQVAATLLRLQGWPKNSLWRLQRILQKHGRVVVNNVGSMFDSSSQAPDISTMFDASLSTSDESLLKSIIFHASCSSPSWKVVAYMMKPDATKQFEYLFRAGMPPACGLCNLWALEVGFPNMLHDSWNAIKELIST